MKTDDGFKDAGIIRRLDEATAPSAGKGAMKQGDELCESLSRSSQRGGLSKRLEAQRSKNVDEAVDMADDTGAARWVHLRCHI